MKVISFINRKGGSGKSTCATNVASSFKELGFHVALLETDNNQSLIIIRNHEPQPQAGTNRYDLYKTIDDNAVKTLHNLRRKMYDIVIVDGAANMPGTIAASIAAASDIVIIPTSLSPQELLVTQMTVNEILPVIRAKPGLKVVILPNRIHHFCLQETVCNTLAPLNLPVLDVNIPNLKEYTQVSTSIAATGYKHVVTLILNLLAETKPQAIINDSKQESLPTGESFRHYKYCTYSKCTPNGGILFGTNNDKRETCSERCKKGRQREMAIEQLSPTSSLMPNGI